MLVGLQTQTFTTLLNGLSLGEAEWQLLSFLAAGLDLPFEGLVALLNKDVKDVAEALTKLIDLNLVQPSDEGYAISAPIRFAVQAIRGFLSDADYSTITKRLKERFWESGEGLPSLQVVDSTIAAALRSDSEGKDFRQFVIPSALFRAAKNLHDLRGFDSLVKSRRLLQRLLEIEPRDRKALSLLCKIQARLGEFEKARTVLETIHAAGYIEEFFLTGFILWKKRDYIDAVAAFRTTIAKGNRGAEVFHGLGSCLLRMKLLDDADREIDNGSRGRKPNRMLIDLAAQIAIERGDYAKADGLIEQLLILRAEADYHHRKATLLNKQGKYREALSHARIAAGDFTRRFEAETVLIDTLIELGEVDEADQKLEDLEKRERHQRDRRDIVLGLRSKMWLKKGNWRQAESMCRAMENKDSDYYTGLLVEALNQKIADLGLSPGIRAEARAELQSYLGTGLSAAPSFALAGDAVSVEFEEEGDDQLVS